MADAVARAKYLRVSPRKLRLVADLIRGKKVSEARDILRFTVKGGSPLMEDVLNSAVANAESKAAERRERINTDDMIIARLLVDGGFTFRRYHGAPRGRLVRIRRRTSHVEMTISSQ